MNIPLTLRRRRPLSAPRRSLVLQPHYDPEAFGRFSEGVARLIGTARFLVFQTVVVVVWIILNAVVPSLRFDEYPFILTTGRVLEHWHGGTMTRHSHLDDLYPAARLEMHPADAARAHPFGLARAVRPVDDHRAGLYRHRPGDRVLRAAQVEVEAREQVDHVPLVRRQMRE